MRKIYVRTIDIGELIQLFGHYPALPYEPPYYLRIRENGMVYRPNNPMVYGAHEVDFPHFVIR